jgi:SNF2 family DNA or RNA helicase
MASLEHLKAGTLVKGLVPNGVAKVVTVEWYGNQAIKVVFEDADGAVKNRLLYRTDEPKLEVVTQGKPWAFNADGSLFRLVSEAYRIRLAYLFDPYLAIHTSLVEPLPHQITAVYGEMLPRQPLRFLLADDPGAGKTIMAGLLIKELMLRGDLERCLIVAPGSLVEQWQDELYAKFGLSFDILSRDQVEASRSGNPFNEKNLLIARLDMMSRSTDLQACFTASADWDLVICDEAHKMSASYFGGEVKYTKRYNLGRLLGSHCRHFLLMTATPHNGKEADFQLFMGLLDSDRFEGKFRDGVHQIDVTDLIRRLTKEELVKFDGKPLFPERCAYTMTYKLSDPESALYHAVTAYVREEMNRAERFAADDQKRRLNVGFALQILQRRLASSPAAIYQSLVNRRERLENRLNNEEQILQRGQTVALMQPEFSIDINSDLWDEDDNPQEEMERFEQEVVDQATAARTIEELAIEIATLKRLEAKARVVKNSGTDTKWMELNGILDHPLMKDRNDNRRKLIIFTEFRDTLTYLAERIRNRLGKPESVVVVHGGIGREERRKLLEAFRQDKNVLVLLANDAVGEGVNLQRAHLMVNYDLPWNPNRLEQRFGRIHRIGQLEVCHLWNLVADETREGEVYAKLLKKLEVERKALPGLVYDILGKVFVEKSLRDLLIEAIRYGEDPVVKQRLDQVIDNAIDRDHLLQLLEEKALVCETLNASKVAEVREQMERAQARRLQPHFIQSFFIEAFQKLGGQIAPREAGRFEIVRVPGAIRDRDRQIGRGEVVLPRYERVCFEKDKINQTPVAAFICLGHSLLDCTIDLILEGYRDLLKRGAMLVDDADEGQEIRALFYLEQAVQDGRIQKNGQQQMIFQQLQFVEIGAEGIPQNAGPAPYLDYRPMLEAEQAAVLPVIESTDWLNQDFEAQVIGFAIQHIIPKHVQEVQTQRLPMIDKVEREVTSRLRKEINYWDRRAEDLKLQEKAGKRNAKLNSANAMVKAEDLSDRLQRRLRELAQEREISALPPVVKGGALVIPKGLLTKLMGDRAEREDANIPYGRDEIERLAMAAVMETEQQLGRIPRDVSEARGIGYDIESKDPKTGALLFIEVKGRWHQKMDITLTKNEILCSRNEPAQFRLALVLVDGQGARSPQYLKGYTFGEPDFAETTRTFSLYKLLESATRPM